MEKWRAAHADEKMAQIVKRALLTGMSRTGKSSVIANLAARGYRAVDADSDTFSEWVECTGTSDTAGSPVEANRDWVWREDSIRDLLSLDGDVDVDDILFVSGCAPNMGKFLPQFDHVILLSAPPDVIVERLATRTSSAYGKRPEEVARVLGLLKTVEPLLRRIAGHEIDTSVSLDEVVAAVLQIVQ